jgi:hypothetical protein
MRLFDKMGFHRRRRKGQTLADIKPFAFVLMPFEQSFHDIYNLGIKAAAIEAGIVAERVDEQLYSESMLERIYRQIKDCDFVIADMTGRNPNVFYEVGYAHAMGKSCTLITKSSDDIPFDLKHHRHLVYGDSIAGLKEKLALEFAWHKVELKKKDVNPFSIELKEPIGFLQKTKYSAISEVSLIVDVRNKTDTKSPGINAIYIYTAPGWTIEQDKNNCPSTEEIGAKETLARHFIKTPSARLGPGAWMPIKLKMSKTVWTLFAGQECQEIYTHTGNLGLSISTDEGVYDSGLNLSVECQDAPF